MTIDENKLLLKYKNFIRKEVVRYCIAMQMPSSNQYFDDLFSEASITFLICCRSFSLESYNLDAYQYSVIKNKIHSQLRVALWKMFNMGGYNNRKIDLVRNTVVSDVLIDGCDSVDDVINSGYDQDFTFIEVEDFIGNLSNKDSELLRKLMEGYTSKEISDMFGNNHRVVYQKLKKIQKLYIKHAAA